MYYKIIETPIGKLTLICDDISLTSIAFGEKQMSEEFEEKQLHPILVETSRQLSLFFEGKLQEFNIPLNPSGTTFQKAVWDSLKEIPYGKTVSYGDVAKNIGNPKSVRAVGQANNKNPIPIIIPCHRVVGKDGSLVGYGGGLDIKKYLLALEDSTDKGVAL
ncbi:methylated-DNA--[protein]-cysteine S-methyltransferase [Alkalicella caledoniensis]|uniref:Methylated-DNA--protein-cysteine methyltransferase n=1 Tax=Alkalicella caledoniensis TaxID=2731377 RepID=A0A7G9WA81_ALKCA|nr:methylated-DNA--[protein]-cysteine S-methyltransferase [Alkalicella caledoniensis]QNO15593.1 methylated-DNA--[protein]-cysteine S-methyltransferase [Alkalicella caledoniensis]